MKGLKLTKRGEIVRDLGTGILGAAAVYGYLILSVYALEGMGL